MQSPWIREISGSGRPRSASRESRGSEWPHRALGAFIKPNSAQTTGGPWWWTTRPTVNETRSAGRFHVYGAAQNHVAGGEPWLCKRPGVLPTHTSTRRQHVSLRAGVQDPQHRFQYAPRRHRLAARPLGREMLLRKMLPDAFPLRIGQLQHA
jgi:hypothetical protein